MAAADGGQAIVAGNERVVRARLSDANFFWETDRKVPLEERLEKLKGIVFHEKLGTQSERVERIAALARELAPARRRRPGARRARGAPRQGRPRHRDGRRVPRAAGPDGALLRGAQGENPSVAAAIEEHYKPLGPSDRVPTDPVSVAVALADKIDTLVGFWAIDEKPTGSKDPYALRRAALGVIRLVLENELRHPDSAEVLRSHISTAERICSSYQTRASVTTLLPPRKQLMSSDVGRFEDETAVRARFATEAFGAMVSNRSIDLLSFFADRLKVHLRDHGARHDLIDAVFALPGQDDLLLIVRRVEALGRFLDTEDGKNLLAGYRRAANILRIEEKKDGRAYDGAPDLALIERQGQIEEKALAVALDDARREAAQAVAARRISRAPCGRCRGCARPSTPSSTR